jgi:hypothetical protein
MVFFSSCAHRSLYVFDSHVEQIERQIWLSPSQCLRRLDGPDEARLVQKSLQPIQNALSFSSALNFRA